MGLGSPRPTNKTRGAQVDPTAYEKESDRQEIFHGGSRQDQGRNKKEPRVIDTRGDASDAVHPCRIINGQSLSVACIRNLANKTLKSLLAIVSIN